MPRHSAADWCHCVRHRVHPDDEGPDEHAGNLESCLQRPGPEYPGKHASRLQLCTGGCICNALHRCQSHSGHPSKDGVGRFCSLWWHSQHGCVVLVVLSVKSDDKMGHCIQSHKYTRGKRKTFPILYWSASTP